MRRVFKLSYRIIDTTIWSAKKLFDMIFLDRRETLISALVLAEMVSFLQPHNIKIEQKDKKIRQALS